MTVCHLWTPPGHDVDRCGWCLHPYDTHRFASCPTCEGWQTIVDPTDYSRVPPLHKRRLPCPSCTTGWVFRHTGDAATEQQLAPVMRNRSAE